MRSTSSPTTTCPHCGGEHYGNTVCPRIKAIEYHQNGTVKRVEYFDSSDQIRLGPPPPSGGFIGSEYTAARVD